MSSRARAGDAATDEVKDLNDPDASPLVQRNPAFFDKALAPNVPQIIWVCIPGLQRIPDTSYERLAGAERDDERRSTEQIERGVRLIRDRLDWAALEALVRP